ncbi:MAG: isoamylase early set domain-containing protein [Chitinophagales bacterium]
MSLKKKFLKSKPVCKVTFRLAKAAAQEASTVALVGDFNDWNLEQPIALKALKSGDFKTVLDLETGKNYEYRYLLDGEKWENDWDADQYVPSPYGVDNSVVMLEN